MHPANEREKISKKKYSREMIFNPILQEKRGTEMAKNIKRDCSGRNSIYEVEGGTIHFDKR